MAYIRVKKIKGKPYAYLVENKSTPSGPRQKVKKYLGRVHEIKRRDVKKEINEKEILTRLVLSELQKSGFKKNGEDYTFKNLIFSKNSLKKKTKSNNYKEAIISLNQGYLCSFTLQRLTNFKKTKDFNKDAHMLAKYFLEAGLPISEDDFVNFYQRL